MAGDSGGTVRAGGRLDIDARFLRDVDAQTIQVLLAAAEQAESGKAGPLKAFVASLIIALREGIEVALGRGAMMRGKTELSRGKTLYLVASTRKSSCSSCSLSGIVAARSLLSE